MVFGTCFSKIDLSLASQAAGMKAINIAVTFLYTSGLWLRAADAKKLSKWLLCFLAHYSLLANFTIEESLRRFPMYPKLHMLCHTAIELGERADVSPWVLSPLAFACQQQEDFIGKPSQVSRHTNIRQAHRSVLWRSLVKVQSVLRAASKDERGMDSYPDLQWKSLE